MREIHKDVWVNFLLREIEIDNQMKRFNGYTIPDVRFKNEFKAIKERGGVMIRIIRPDF
jgi:hypothetical protein